MPHPKGSGIGGVGVDVRFCGWLGLGRPYGEPVGVEKLVPAARRENDLQLHGVPGFGFQSVNRDRKTRKHSSETQIGRAAQYNNNAYMYASIIRGACSFTFLLCSQSFPYPFCRIPPRGTCPPSSLR